MVEGEGDAEKESPEAALVAESIVEGLHQYAIEVETKKDHVDCASPNLIIDSVEFHIHDSVKPMGQMGVMVRHIQEQEMPS